jgi:outer membrane protein OmpU
MKTVLMGTTAVALAGLMASPAAAAEWDVRVGGFMEQFVAYVDNDFDTVSGDFNGIDSKQDAEIWFLPSITLDNGIKFGVNIQLEGNTKGDQIDESFLFVKGAFGEVILGSENSAGHKMHYAAPDVTFLNVNSGSFTFFVPFSGSVNGVNVGDDLFLGTLQTTYLENERNNDAQRFTYFTPRFAGFQLGVSYARDGLQDTNVQIDEDSGQIANIFDLGASYVQSFGDFDVAVSGRYGTADTAGRADPDIWGAGINLGYAGFKVGGSYAEQNDALLRNGEAYDVGVSYETGPWGFSATWFHGENIDDENPGTDEENDQYLLGVAYTLAKGVVLNGYGGYMEFDEKLSDGGTGSGDDVDAFIIGTGIRVDF